MFVAFVVAVVLVRPAVVELFVVATLVVAAVVVVVEVTADLAK